MLQIKKSQITNVWTVDEFNDQCFLSIDDAEKQHEIVLKNHPDPEGYNYFSGLRYHDLEECDLPLPQSGRMWHCHGTFYDQRSYFDGEEFEQAQLVEVQVIEG